MIKNIFEKRINIKPYEYAELMHYKDAIRHSYWLHTEFNITPDIQNFKVDLNDLDRDIIKKTLLSISQVEINVKRFWGNLYNYLPKPEIDSIGGTFAESEVRHLDAYSFILETLGLNSDFEKIDTIPAIIDRYHYLEKIMSQDKGKEGVALKILLFSLLIEHISLFGQFYIIMSYNKKRNMFKGLSNIVEATSKEEDIHGNFGIELFKIITSENPDIVTDDFIEQVINLCHDSLKAENKVLDWIFEDGEPTHITKDEVYHFMLNRFNKSLKSINVKYKFDCDKKELKKSNWFDEELKSTKENDFFNKRSVDYSKKNKQVTEDDLF